MSSTDFSALCQALCTQLGVQPPELEPDPLGVVGFTVQLRGVDLAVLHTRPTDAFTLLLVNFGPLDEDREPGIWRALMDANFLLVGPDAPAFSRNPVTGEVLLQHVLPLADVDAAQLRARMVHMAEVALQWRKDFFLSAGAQAQFARPQDPAPSAAFA